MLYSKKLVGLLFKDSLRFLVGDYVKVCGQAGTIITRRKKLHSDEMGYVDVDDYCNYMAEIEGGIPATFNITRFAYERGNYQKVEIYGNKGGLVYTLDEDGYKNQQLLDAIKESYTEEKWVYLKGDGTYGKKN